MGWKIRNRVPSEKYLEEYDKRVADREAEIRRPGRAKEIQAEVEAARKRREAENKARQDFLKKWTIIHMKEVRRRNKFIRYKLFSFFKEHYHLEDQDSRDLSLRALAAVCKSITKDVALYCQLISACQGMAETRAEATFREHHEGHLSAANEEEEPNEGRRTPTAVSPILLELRARNTGGQR